jgi:predicted nucleic acid-binding protein
MRFIDTNVFLRYLTGDDSAKAMACRTLIERVHEGSEQITTSESVVAEIVFVLRSTRHYNVPASQVRDLLAPIIAMPALLLDHKKTFLRALDLMATHPTLDFEDALSDQHMRRQDIEEIYSYDTDFDRIESTSRIEPSSAEG